MNRSDGSFTRAWTRAYAQQHTGLWSGLVFLLALLLAPSVGARVNTDKPLAADEGWLLVIADNQALANSLLLDGPGLLNNDLVGLGVGRNVRLLRAKAGSYRWSRVTRGRYYWNMQKQPVNEFTVAAGVINYPGNFILNSSSPLQGTFFLSNRALQAMMALETNFPGIRARYAWRSDVSSPDPFVEFAADKFSPDKIAPLLASADADAEKSRARKLDENFGKIFNDIYAAPRVTWPSLSPDGKLLAYLERRKGGEVAVVVDLATGESLDVKGVEGSINQLVWASERALYVGTSADLAQVVADVSSGARSPTASVREGLNLIRLGEGTLDPDKVSSIHLSDSIAVLDPLNNSATRGLLVRSDSEGEVHPFAFDETSKAFDVRDFRPEHRLDKGLEKVLRIYADRKGELRAAVVGVEDGRFALAVRGTDGKWTQRPPLPGNIRLAPVALSTDGSYLIVLTDHGREQMEMVKLPLDSGELGETLLAVPGADLVGGYRRTRDGSVIGAYYYRNGSVHTRYLASEEDAQLAAVSRQFPGSSVVVIDDSRDGRRVLLLVASDTNPGSVYLFDRDQRKVEKLFDQMDPFKHAKLAASTAFSVQTADGLTVQSFLTLPAEAKGKVPLVVMAHGGPIGVADNLEFDPGVQMLASSGFGVLRVNYRGSGGAGRAFMRAGHGKWGREIEADIDQALEYALKNFPVDRERIALWGASYGGYSTLMNLIGKPEKYRCGVAVAAVTDLPLFFSSADWSRNDKAVQEMKEIVGDPQTQMAQLREYSPVYQYQRLKRPLLLIHGTEDMRVSFEHTWRLRSLLAADGRAPELLILPGADHSLSGRKDLLAMHAVSDSFLRECLGAAAAASAP